MSRWHRILVGLLTAYAASMTLVASNSVWLYRRGFDALYQGKHGRPPGYPTLMDLVADFGMNLTFLERWSLILADFRSKITAPAVVAFALAGVGAGLSIFKPSRTNPDKD